MMQILPGCRESYPCGHTVIIDGQKRGMSGDGIYKWHVERNLPIPEHFQDYKKYVEEQDVAECIRNNDIAKLRKFDPKILSNDMNRDNSPIVSACSVSIELVKVLHEEMGIKLSQPCLVEASKVGNMEIIEYLTSKGLLPTEEGMYYCGHGGKTAYSMAAQHSHRNLLEYFEENFQITESAILGAIFDTRPEDPTIHLYVSTKVDPQVIELYKKIKDRTLTRHECICLMANLHEDSDRYNMLWTYLQTFVKNRW